MLSINSLSFSYDSQNFDSSILYDFSFEIAEKKIVALVGKSGSGKSTILNLISGLLQPHSGEVILNNKKISSPVLDISYQKQQTHLLDYRNGLENALLGLELRGELSEVNRIRTEEYFNIFDIREASKKFPNELSGGMRQRVNLIRTLTIPASIYLLDEPFSGIDSTTIRIIQESIWNKIKNNRSSLIFVTHNLEQALELSDSVAFISSRSKNIKTMVEFDNEFQCLTPSNRKENTNYSKYLFDLVRVLSDSE